MFLKVSFSFEIFVDLGNEENLTSSKQMVSVLDVSDFNGIEGDNMTNYGILDEIQSGVSHNEEQVKAGSVDV